jgi:hypothetical protein
VVGGSSGTSAGATVLMGIVTTDVLLFADIFLKTENNFSTHCSPPLSR